MFTIKHVTDPGEAIYLGAEVMYHNGFDSAAAEQVMYLDGKDWKSLRFGVVYVMNDAGKTVSHYDMRGLVQGGYAPPSRPSIP